MSSDEKTENELNDDFLNTVQNSQSSGHITEDQPESPESISERRRRLEEELDYVKALENKDKHVENPDVKSPEQFEQELIANQPHPEEDQDHGDPHIDDGEESSVREAHAEDENNIGEEYHPINIQKPVEPAPVSIEITATRTTEEDLKEDQNQSNDVIPEEETPPWETPVA